MSVKLLTEHYLEFLSLKEAAQARLILHLSKYHIIGNHIFIIHSVSERKALRYLMILRVVLPFHYFIDLAL